MHYFQFNYNVYTYMNESYLKYHLQQTGKVFINKSVLSLYHLFFRGDF